MNNLTVKQVRDELVAVGVNFRSLPETREFRVVAQGKGEESAYYTDDLQDALDTGKAMAPTRYDRIKQQEDEDSGKNTASVVICFEGQDAKASADQIQQRFEYYIRQGRPANIKAWLQEFGCQFCFVKVHDCQQHPLK